ncbi:Protein bicaudal C 1 [Liparis tanakae]|uniref:Protein bicaudal C 1 n=1 Tax=Liparis tanakae TaxID=230148 RepID=A0A4Z2HXK5_9TELE|nr:Protein bicaudal C 1 [Liparis tanakae]
MKSKRKKRETSLREESRHANAEESSGVIPIAVGNRSPPRTSHLSDSSRAHVPTLSPGPVPEPDALPVGTGVEVPSVIVKSVERNAVNMYEARKFLLGLESSGVTSTSSSSSPPSVMMNPATTIPSPSFICPVGLDILASAGLGLSNLGMTLYNYSLHPARKRLVSKDEEETLFFLPANALKMKRLCRGR